MPSTLLNDYIPVNLGMMSFMCKRVWSYLPVLYSHLVVWFLVNHNSIIRNSGFAKITSWNVVKHTLMLIHGCNNIEYMEVCKVSWQTIDYTEHWLALKRKSWSGHHKHWCQPPPLPKIGFPFPRLIWNRDWSSFLT